MTPRTAAHRSAPVRPSMIQRLAPTLAIALVMTIIAASALGVKLISVSNQYTALEAAKASQSKQIAAFNDRLRLLSIRAETAETNAGAANKRLQEAQEAAKKREELDVRASSELTTLFRTAASGVPAGSAQGALMGKILVNLSNITGAFPVGGTFADDGSPVPAVNGQRLPDWVFAPYGKYRAQAVVMADGTVGVIAIHFKK